MMSPSTRETTGPPWSCADASGANEMPDLARLSVESDGDIELARVAGEVDASNVADLSQRCSTPSRTDPARSSWT